MPFFLRRLCRQPFMQAGLGDGCCALSRAACASRGALKPRGRASSPARTSHWLPCLPPEVLLDNHCRPGEPRQPQPTHRHHRKRSAGKLKGSVEDRGWAQGHCKAWCPREGGTNKPSPTLTCCLVCHHQNLNDVKNKYKPWLVQTDLRSQLVER